MRKLFLSTLSLLLLFGSADRGLLLNTIAEETEPAEATPETSPEVSPEPSAETADPAPEVQEEDPQSEEEAPAAVEEAPAKEAEEEAAKDEPDASQVQSIALDGDDPEVVSNYTIWYEPNSELFNTRYCTWNLDGEEIEFAEEGVSKEYQTGQDFVCPENAPVSPGLTFLGWSLSKEGPAEFKPGESYPAFEAEDDSITLYAQWETEVYSLTVELNGGKAINLKNNQMFYDFRHTCDRPKYEDEYEEYYDKYPYTQGGNYCTEYLDHFFEEVAPYTRKPGYQLEGYYLDPSFTELYVGYAEGDEDGREWGIPAFSFEKEPRNCTLYAKWTPRKYNIIYELGEGETSEGNPEEFTAGECLELNDAVKEGYEFVGWSLFEYDEYEKNPTLRVLSVDEIIELFNVRYADEDDYYLLDEESITLYPIFREGRTKADSYSIEYSFSSDRYDVFDVSWDAYEDFVTGNTSYEADDRNYGTNSKYKCPSVKPTAPGLAFQGWSRTKDGPTEFKSGSSYASLAEKPGIKVTLYAVWKPNTYTLKINLNGGTFPEMNLLSASTKYDFCLLKNPEDEECVVTSSGNYSAETVAEMLFASYWIEEYMPQKPGFAFDGFYTDKQFKNNFVENIEDIGKQIIDHPANRTLYVKWAPKNYTVNYHLDGGVEPAKGNPEQYTGGTTAKLNNPTKEGYKFVGWYLDSEFQGDKITSLSPKTAIPQDGETVDLYARWTNNQSFKLAYNLNGGKGKLETAPVLLEKETVTLRTPAHRDGYEFIGWSLNKKEAPGEQLLRGEVEVADLNPEQKQGKTVTLYARWNPIEYFIQYELNGGENDPANPETYNASMKTVKINNPLARAGYAFEGWFDNPKFTGKKITSIKGSEMTGCKLYAKWKEYRYTLKFDPNGSSMYDFGDAKEYAWTDEIRAPYMDETDSKWGFDFIGWNTRIDGTGIAIEPSFNWREPVYVNGAKLGAANNSAITLYAQYVPWDENYTISFAGDELEPIECSSKEAVVLENPEKRPGYTFVGWYENPYFTGNKITGYPVGTVFDRTLYAQWKDNSNKNVFTIKYNLAGAKGTMETTTAGIASTDHAYLKDAPYRTGYEFKCWKDSKGNTYKAGEQIGNPAKVLGASKGKTITLTAVWEAKPYTIHLHSNADNGFFVNKDVYQYDSKALYDDEEEYDDEIWGVEVGCTQIDRTHIIGKSVIIDAVPVRPGYKFMGWAETPNANSAKYKAGKKYNSFSKDGEDIHLYAVWKK